MKFQRRLIDFEKIKSLRVNQNLTIDHMSKVLGYDGYNAYYYKENGKRKISAEEIAIIAKVLGVPIETLFFENKITDSVTKFKEVI
ncbi:helix-turn-helix domain-containing protein [Rossellomorea vietnamensis]|uniref:Helix-turn-helix domain-containing protein n=1 Tax=Rossellomorea vietnamensis TaxID=218284 RepID=A0ACD4C770_9BACI|nr:helix-turn-helix transcriptional regulator [Rossellomorea vietnamensis]UXH44433.1 helix-turn-helix domain-containing protein [Rossellomorea vietnamensis]